MSRLIGFLFFVFFLLAGIMWAHFCARQNWVASSSSSTTIGAANNTNQENFYSHPLADSRRLYTDARELWKDDDKDEAIETLEDSIGSADRIKEDHEDFYENENNRTEVTKWQNVLQDTLQEWKGSSAAVEQETVAPLETPEVSEQTNLASITPSVTLPKQKDIPANEIVSDQGLFSSTSSTSSTTESIDSTFKEPEIVEVTEEETEIQIVAKQLSIAGTPPPPLARVEEPKAEPSIVAEDVEEDNSFEFTIDTTDKTEMWLNGYNSFEDGEDYMEAEEHELAIISYRKSKAWYDGLNKFYPEYQSETVQWKREELSRKINRLREIY